jgi:hypothetical protein
MSGRSIQRTDLIEMSMFSRWNGKIFIWRNQRCALDGFQGHNGGRQLMETRFAAMRTKTAITFFI